MKNNRIVYVLVVFALMFLGLAAHLTYIQVFKGEEYIGDSNNQRNRVQSQTLIKHRGLIYDINGILLAYNKEVETLDKDGNVKKNSEGKPILEDYREYPYKNLYSHVIGHYNTSSSNYIELQYNEQLTSIDFLDEYVMATNKDKELVNQGNSLKLTIDHRIQEFAKEKLDNSGLDGAIIVMNPQTGAILAMVSNPDYNPDAKVFLKESAELIELQSKNVPTSEYPSHLRSDNRSEASIASSEIFAPGSTFKIVTAAALLEHDMVDDPYLDTGLEENTKITGPARGLIDITDALKYSSNPYFANGAYRLDIDKMRETAEKFLFNKKIPLGSNNIVQSYYPSEYVYPGNLGQSAIGQWDTKASPLHMCLVASTIANDGVMMKPYFVDSVYSSDGRLIEQTLPVKLSECISPSTAETIKQGMWKVVNSSNGTGTRAQITKYNICGKTGTAETGDSSDNVWFVSFAPRDNAKIAVTVFLKNGSSGGGNAAPIAKEIYQKYFELYPLDK